MTVLGKRHQITSGAIFDSVRTRPRRAAVIGTLLTTLCAMPMAGVAQQPGDLDTSFGAAGKVVTYIGLSNVGQAVALQPDGKIVMGGYSFDLATLSNEFALTRYMPDGNLDASFGGDGIVTTSFRASNALVQSVALQPDGKIIAAGYVVTSAFFSFALARYLPNGSLDTTFDGDGKVTIDIPGGVGAIVLQPDGKIVAVGFTALARFHSDGALDTTFGTGGVVNVDFEQSAAAVQPDGKIVTAGAISTSQREFALARFLSDGMLDTTFHGDGRVNTVFDISDFSGLGGDAGASAVSLQPDGKIIAAGAAIVFADGHVDFALARYLPDGALDATFGGGDGRVTTDFGDDSAAAAMTLQPDGKIVAAGVAFGSFGLARYLPDGTLDTNFSDDGLVTTSFGADRFSRALALVLQPDGRLVAGGSVTRPVEGIAFALARYESGLLLGVGPPTTKEQCKHSGWRTFDIPRAFKNQGDCIQFVNTRN
jgi:uncharacterized delta-60 repeat protein